MAHVIEHLKRLLSLIIMQQLMMVRTAMEEEIFMITLLLILHVTHVITFLKLSQTWTNMQKLMLALLRTANMGKEIWLMMNINIPFTP